MGAEHVDVLIIGAGLTGIGAGYRLHERFPNKTYAILESRQDIGGTWALFTYPGVRSDSDMYTLGYRFRPWTNPKAIADGPSILDYIRDTAHDGDVNRHIRFGRRAAKAEWDSQTARWTVTSEDVETGETSAITCGFLFMCSGYYRYDEGYTPEFADRDLFGGQIIHPQHWPNDLDYTGKRVVVIGSGATAVTLVPAMAPQADHVTMLQRSPTYIASVPGTDKVANLLRRVLPVKAAYAITRWKNVLFQMFTYQLAQRAPKVAKSLLRKGQEKALPADFDIDTHLTPRYNPWDQRLCAIPDGDMFEVLSDGSASIVTDQIERFTETGIKLVSGLDLPADIIVTATGLNMRAFGNLDIFVDGVAIDIARQMVYKGIMLSDVPSLAFGFGYTNASWTLKIDLTYDYVLRLLDHMDRTGTDWCMPRRDPSVHEAPFLDFESGYVQRAIRTLPKSGDKAPWRVRMNYLYDVVTMSRGRVDDDTMEFGRASTTAVAAPVAAAS